MKPIGTKQVKEFDFPLASKAKAKSEEKREIEAQVTDPVTPEELDADMSDYDVDWKGRNKRAQVSFQKYVDLAFGNKGEKPRHRIPANPEDDDLFVSNYIRESGDEIARLEAETAKFRELHVQLGCFPGSSPEEFIECAKELVAERREFAIQNMVLQSENTELREQLEAAKAINRAFLREPVKR